MDVPDDRVPKRLPDIDVDRHLRRLFGCSSAVHSTNSDINAKAIADVADGIIASPCNSADGCLSHRLGLPEPDHYDVGCKMRQKKKRLTDRVDGRYHVFTHLDAQNREFFDFDKLYRWCKVFFGLCDLPAFAARGAVAYAMGAHLAHLLGLQPLPRCNIARIRNRNNLVSAVKLMTRTLSGVRTVKTIDASLKDETYSQVIEALRTRYEDGPFASLADCCPGEGEKEEGVVIDMLSRLPGMSDIAEFWTREHTTNCIQKACVHLLHLARFDAMSLDADDDVVVAMGRIAVHIDWNLYYKICMWTQVWGIFNAWLCDE